MRRTSNAWIGTVVVAASIAWSCASLLGIEDVHYAAEAGAGDAGGDGEIIDAGADGEIAADPCLGASPDAAAGRLYVVGGTDENATMQPAFSAAVRCDGTLDEWTPERSPPGFIYRVPVVLAGGFVVVPGENSTGVGRALRAPILDGGALGTWLGTGEDQPLLDSIQSAATATGDRGWLIGGLTLNHAIAGFAVAPDGGITVADAGTYPATGWRSAAVVAQGSLFVIGGEATDDTLVVKSAPISDDGGIGDFQPAGTTPVAIAFGAAVTVGDRIWVVGSEFDRSVVLSGRPTMTGLIDLVRSTPLTKPRSEHGLATLRGRLYVVGGLLPQPEGGVFPLDSVLVGTPLDDGGVRWEDGTKLPFRRSGGGAVAR